MKLSVVVPCFNEEQNLPALLGGFQKALEGLHAELILVENGSTDGSRKWLKSELDHFPFARAIYIDHNRGYGNGILEGLKESQGEFTGWTHADLQTDPEDISKAYALIAAENFNPGIFIKGLRKDRSLSDRFISYGMGVYETALLGVKMTDINAQPCLFHRSFFMEWKNPPLDYSLDLYAFYVARRMGLKVIRFNVCFPPRRFGQSHWNSGLLSKWRFIRTTIQYSRDMKKNSRTWNL